MEKRWQSLDELRGFVMVLLTMFFPLAFFDRVPWWLKHSPGNGLCIEDLGAPAFLFVLGVSYFLSFTKRRQMMGDGALVWSFLRRYLLFAAFGFMGEIVTSGGFRFRWSVLETIGVGGFLVLPFMYANCKVRIASAFAIPLVWQLLVSAGHERWALAYDFGGPWAVPAWTSLILLGSVMPELKVRVKEGLFLASLLGIALFLSIIGENAMSHFPVNKHLVSFSYLMLSAAVSVFCLAVFVAKGTVGCPPSRSLVIVGKNSFLIYSVAGLESLLVGKTLPPSLAPGWIVAVTAAVSLSCITAAWIMDRKKLYFKI